MNRILHPVENLARFRWHTGAEPIPVSADAAPSLLFRDIGPIAMAQFLRAGGGLLQEIDRQLQY